MLKNLKEQTNASQLKSPDVILNGNYKVSSPESNASHVRRPMTAKANSVNCFNL